MEIGEKLNILADAAKYDVSCSSSGSSRKIWPAAWEMLSTAEYAIHGQQMVGVFLS
mgnify:CR=1 FL=1